MITDKVIASLIVDMIHTVRTRVASCFAGRKPTKHVTRFWEFAKHDEVFVVLPKTHTLPDHDSNETAEKTVNIHSAAAFYFITHYLERTGTKPKILLSERGLAPHEDRANLVLIGGTLGNLICMKKCADIIDRLEIYWFDDIRPGVPRVLRHRYNEKHRYETEFIRGSRQETNGRAIERDFGLVLKFQNPSNPDTTIIVVAGNYGAGTLAATRAVLDDKLLHQVYSDASISNWLGFVVEGYPRDWDVTRYALKQESIFRIRGVV